MAERVPLLVLLFPLFPHSSLPPGSSRVLIVRFSVDLARRRFFEGQGGSTSMHTSYNTAGPPGKTGLWNCFTAKKSLTRKPDSPSAGVCQMAVEQCNSTAHSIGRPWRPLSQITTSRNPWARRLGAISIREKKKIRPCLSPLFHFSHMAIPLPNLNGPHGPTRSSGEGIKKEKKKRH